MKEILERLEQKMDAGFAKADRRFDKMDERLDTVDEQLQKQGVLLESVSADVKMALEGVAGNREVMDKKFAEVLTKLDERVQPVELATRYLATKKTKSR